MNFNSTNRIKFNIVRNSSFPNSAFNSSGSSEQSLKKLNPHSKLNIKIKVTQKSPNTVKRNLEAKLSACEAAPIKKYSTKVNNVAETSILGAKSEPRRSSWIREMGSPKPRPRILEENVSQPKEGRGPERVKKKSVGFDRQFSEPVNLVANEKRDLSCRSKSLEEIHRLSENSNNNGELRKSDGAKNGRKSNHWIHCPELLSEMDNGVENEGVVIEPGTDSDVGGKQLIVEKVKKKKKKRKKEKVSNGNTLAPFFGKEINSSKNKEDVGEMLYKKYKMSEASEIKLPVNLESGLNSESPKKSKLAKTPSNVPINSPKIKDAVELLAEEDEVIEGTPENSPNNFKLKSETSKMSKSPKNKQKNCDDVELSASQRDKIIETLIYSSINAEKKFNGDTPKKKKLIDETPKTSELIKSPKNCDVVELPTGKKDKLIEATQNTPKNAEKKFNGETPKKKKLIDETPKKSELIKSPKNKQKNCDTVELSAVKKDKLIETPIHSPSINGAKKLNREIPKKIKFIDDESPKKSKLIKSINSPKINNAIIPSPKEHITSPIKSEGQLTPKMRHESAEIEFDSKSDSKIDIIDHHLHKYFDDSFSDVVSIKSETDRKGKHQRSPFDRKSIAKLEAENIANNFIVPKGIKRTRSDVKLEFSSDDSMLENVPKQILEHRKRKREWADPDFSLYGSAKVDKKIKKEKAERALARLNEKLAKDTKSELDQFEKLENFEIILPHEVAPLHTILTRASCATKEQTKKLEELGIFVRTGYFTQEEDDMIYNNWDEFCHLHGLPDNPAPFLKFESKTFGEYGTRLENRRKFLQFIAHGLYNRPLSSVHRRFKTMYRRGRIKHGRFTALETEYIIKYMQTTKSRTPFLDIGKVLNRHHLTIELRYDYLLGHRNVLYADYKTVLKYVQKYTKTKNVEDLREKQIPAQVWQKIGEKMDKPARRIERCYELNIYPKLFIPQDFEFKQRAVERAAKIISAENYTLLQYVDWKKVAEQVGGITGDIMKRIFTWYINRDVPLDKQGTLKDILRYIIKSAKKRKKKLAKVKEIDDPEEDEPVKKKRKRESSKNESTVDEDISSAKRKKKKKAKIELLMENSAYLLTKQGRIQEEIDSLM